MLPITYLTIEEVTALHGISITEFGGLEGLRDLGLLESAVLQPQQSFGGEDLYSTLWEKGASLAYSISENQPFLDGNKRTAALSMLVFLDINGYEVIVDRGEIYETIIKVANKQFLREDLANWLKKNSRPVQE